MYFFLVTRLKPLTKKNHNKPRKELHTTPWVEVRFMAKVSSLMKVLIVVIRDSKLVGCRHLRMLVELSSGVLMSTSSHPDLRLKS